MTKQHLYQRRLRDALSERVARNSRFSLRAFARLLDLDPGTFSQMLSGKRFPSPTLSKKIFRHLNWSPEEQQDFLQSLAQAKSEAGLKRISPVLREMLKKDQKFQHRPTDLSIDLFKSIADWYHFAILELPFTEGFKSDPRWIAKSLGITDAEAHSAIQRLLALELLELNDGKLSRCHQQLVSADRHLTTAAHRRRVKEVLNKSIESLEQDPIAVRNHTAMTFAIDQEKIPEAKKRIEKFISEMTEFLESGKRDRVYEMTVNLFPLQKQKGAKS